MSEAITDLHAYASALTRIGKHSTTERHVGTKALARIHVGKDGVVIAVIDSFGRLTAGINAPKPS